MGAVNTSSGIALRDDAPVDADHVRQVGGDRVELVRREHDGHALAVEVRQQVEHLVTRPDVHAAGGLVRAAAAPGRR